MVIQFFLILPANAAKDYRCEIPIKNDVSFYTMFPQDSYIMPVHGLKTYQNKSFAHILYNDIDNGLIQAVTENTGIINPFSIVNYKATNTKLSTLVDAIICPRFEDIFFYYPEMEGTEAIMSQDENGDPVNTERAIIQKSVWSGNPLDYSIFEA